MTISFVTGLPYSSLVLFPLIYSYIAARLIFPILPRMAHVILELLVALPPFSRPISCHSTLLLILQPRDWSMSVSVTHYFSPFYSQDVMDICNMCLMNEEIMPWHASVHFYMLVHYKNFLSIPSCSSWNSHSCYQILLRCHPVRKLFLTTTSLLPAYNRLNYSLTNPPYIFLWIRQHKNYILSYVFFCILFLIHKQHQHHLGTF